MDSAEEALPDNSSTIDGESPVRRVADAISTASPSEAGDRPSTANAEADAAFFKSGFSASNANLSCKRTTQRPVMSPGKLGLRNYSVIGCPARLDRLLTIGMEMEAAGNRRNSSSRLTTKTTLGQRREPPKMAGDGSAGGAAAPGTAGGEACRGCPRGKYSCAAVKCPLRFRILSEGSDLPKARQSRQRECRLEPLNIVNAGVRVYVLSGRGRLQSVPLESKKVPYSPDEVRALWRVSAHRLR